MGQTSALFLSLGDCPVRLLLEHQNSFRTLNNREEYLLLDVTIDNLTLKFVEAGIQLEIYENAYFFGRKLVIETPLQPEGTVTCKTKLYSKANCSAQDFPHFLSLCLILPHSKENFKGDAHFSTGALLGDFTAPNESWNVVFCGPIGHGKSSLINGLLTCLTRQGFVNALPTLELPGERVTTALTAVEVGDIEEVGFPECPFVFYDCWGIGHDDFAKFQPIMDMIFTGKMPDSFPVDSLEDFNADDLSSILQQGRQEADCLVIVIRLKLMSRNLEILIRSYSRLWQSHKKIGPVFVFTGIDELSSQELSDHKKKIKTLVSSPYVFFIKNYSIETRRDHVMDFGFRKVLLKIRELCRRNIALNYKWSLFPQPGVPLSKAMNILSIEPKGDNQLFIVEDFYGADRSETLSVLWDLTSSFSDASKLLSAFSGASSIVNEFFRRAGLTSATWENVLANSAYSDLGSYFSKCGLNVNYLRCFPTDKIVDALNNLNFLSTPKAAIIARKLQESTYTEDLYSLERING
jgi:hypothetical protein